MHHDNAVKTLVQIEDTSTQMRRVLALWLIEKACSTHTVYKYGTELYIFRNTPVKGWKEYSYLRIFVNMARLAISYSLSRLCPLLCKSNVKMIDNQHKLVALSSEVLEGK